MFLIKSAFALLGALLITGCSSSAVIQQNGPTTHELLSETQNNDQVRGVFQRTVHHDSHDQSGFQYKLNQELNNEFPMVPNPELMLWIFPHINKDGAPILGQATKFMMYEQNHYALPGEISH